MNPRQEVGGYLFRIARTFSKDKSVEVMVGGAGNLHTRFDKKTGKAVIHIPETAASLVGSDRAAFEGAIDHEMAHVRAQIEAPYGKKLLDASAQLDEENPKDRLIAILLNVVEDVRIELDSMARWLGMRRNLEAVAAWALTESKAKVLAGEKLDTLFLFGSAFYCRGLHRDHLFADWMPGDIMALLDAPTVQAELEFARFAQHPIDSLEIARRLAAPLAPCLPPPPESPRGGCGGHEHGDGMGTLIHRAIEALSERATEVALADPKRILPHPRAKAADRTIVPSPIAGSDLGATARPYVGGVANRLAMLLRSRTPTRVLDREQGDLDTSVLALVATGHRTPFSEMQKEIKLNAAVSILIDCSSSMDRCMGEAQAAGYCMGEALHRIGGIAFEVFGWSDPDEAVDIETLPEVERQLYTRFYGKVTRRVKSFDEPWVKCRPRLSGLVADGWTDDAGAIIERGQSLAARREELKILLVLTDGHPCHSGGDGKPEGFLGGLLTGAITDCKRAGIRVGAVGIGTDFVKNYYDPWVTVHRMADLASASTRLLGSMLKGAVRR